MLSLALCGFLSTLASATDPTSPLVSKSGGLDSKFDQSKILLIEDDLSFRKVWCRHIGLDPKNPRDLKVSPDVKVDFDKHIVICIFSYDEELPQWKTAWSKGKHVLRSHTILRQTGAGGDEEEASESQHIKVCEYRFLIFPKGAISGFEVEHEVYDRSTRRLRYEFAPLQPDSLEALKD